MQSCPLYHPPAPPLSCSLGDSLIPRVDSSQEALAQLLVNPPPQKRHFLRMAAVCPTSVPCWAGGGHGSHTADGGSPGLPALAGALALCCSCARSSSPLREPRLHAALSSAPRRLLVPLSSPPAASCGGLGAGSWQTAWHGASIGEEKGSAGIEPPRALRVPGQPWAGSGGCAGAGSVGL